MIWSIEVTGARLSIDCTKRITFPNSPAEFVPLPARARVCCLSVIIQSQSRLLSRRSSIKDLKQDGFSRSLRQRAPVSTSPLSALVHRDLLVRHNLIALVIG